LVVIASINPQFTADAFDERLNNLHAQSITSSTVVSKIAAPGQARWLYRSAVPFRQNVLPVSRFVG